MTLSKRVPSGRPPYPITLLSGIHNAGKSYAAAQASASDRIGRTYWLSVGELDPDEYGSFGRFDIIEHDNTLAGQLGALVDIVGDSHEHKDDPKRSLLVVDSVTPWWAQVSAHAQHVANERALERTKQVVSDAPITSDLWARANGYWSHVMYAIRHFHGPVILTARLEGTTVYENGQATSERDDKIKSQKTLPYDVDVVVEMPERGETYLTGARSAALRLDRRRRIDDFTVDGLWTDMDFDNAVPRIVSQAAPTDSFVFATGAAA